MGSFFTRANPTGNRREKGRASDHQKSYDFYFLKIKHYKINYQREGEIVRYTRCTLSPPLRLKNNAQSS